MQAYSDFFKTLHDETSPTGSLGRGTHYSVLRAVVFHDPVGKPLSEGQFADFAVIWDEDHDTRVIEPIEEIYRRGLLSSFLMFGEHKGYFTAILSSKVLREIEAIPFNPVFFRRLDELDLNLSVRAENCLRNDDMVCLGDLVQMTEGELLRTPRCGRKSLNEIKGALAQMNLHLGMQVPGWPTDNATKNIKDFIKDFIKDKDRVDFLETEINAICRSLNDPWTAQVVEIGSAGNPIIGDDDQKVSLYLKNLEMLWQLGIVARRPQKSATLVTAPPTPNHPTPAACH